VTVLEGSFTIGVPEDVRNRIVDEFGRFVTNALRESARLGSFGAQPGDLADRAIDQILDLLPDQLSKDSWRSVLAGAVGQVLPWLTGSSLVEAVTFAGTLQLIKDVPESLRESLESAGNGLLGSGNFYGYAAVRALLALKSKPDIVSYTLWTYAAEFEARPEVANLVKPLVQEFFSFLRGNDNPNSLWAWLAEDTGRVNEHLNIFEARMDASDPGTRLAPEFAYNSATFNEFLARSEINVEGKVKTELFPRLDYIVLRGLSEMGTPRTASDVASDWWQKFADAAEKAFNEFVARIKAGVERAGEYVKERWDAAGEYVKERWDAAGNYMIERRDAAGKYVTEHWDAANNYVLERGDAAGKYYTEQQNAAGAVLAKGWKDAGRWVSQTLDAAGNRLKEWIYYDDAGQNLYQWRAWASNKLTDFEQYTAAGWREISKWVHSSGQWISQKLNSAGLVLQEWIYYDAAGTKLRQYGAWASGKLTELARYTSDGVTRTFWAYVSTTGNWVERNYSNGVETAVRVWNSAGTYLGDQLKNYSDGAAKLDPTTKSWWPL
jgi:hypothetical protein